MEKIQRVSLEDSHRSFLAKDSTRRTPRPFLKWAGGKSQLLDELQSRVPWRFERYVEAFLGGGALFFSVVTKAPSTGSLLLDVNSDLMNAFTVVRDDVERLILSLVNHEFSAEYYYALRAADRAEDFSSWSPLERASRLLFLNRTCFNGLYRVNARGHFNVPFGDYKNPRICDADNLRAGSVVLQGCTLATGDFTTLDAQLKSGDFVYLDPPYLPVTTTASFTSYHAGGFNDADHIRLRDFCRTLSSRGIQFMLSNSSTPLSRELYSEFRVETVKAARSINSQADKRGAVEEIIVRNY